MTMVVNEFHTIVVSNTEDERNTGAHFFNRLSSPLDLEREKWEVGVKKLIYYNSFNNIIDESVLMGTKTAHEIKVPAGKWVNNKFDSTHRNISIYMMDSVLDEGSTDGVVVFLSCVQNNPYGPDPPNFIGWRNYRDIELSVKYSSSRRIFNDDPMMGDGDLQWGGGVDTPIEVNEGAITEGEDKVNINLDKLFPDAIAVAAAAPAKTYINAEKLDEKEYDASKSLIWRAWIPDLHAEDIEELVVDMSFTFVDYVPLKQGYYTTIDSFLKDSGIKNTPHTKFSKTPAGKIEVKLDTDRIKWIEFQNSLEYTLGFDKAKIFDKISVGRYKPQLDRGCFAFFIYSNLVAHMNVGDKDVKLLDVITIPKAEYATPVSVDVLSPLYRPVTTSLIHEIEVALYSDSGEKIVFNNTTGSAKTLILLHFRKI